MLHFTLQVKDHSMTFFKIEMFFHEFPNVVSEFFQGYQFIFRYSDSQKHNSSCLLSDRFWCISPEPFEVQKIFLPLLALLFEELSDRIIIFQIGAQIYLILRKTLFFQRKSQLLKKIHHFEKFKNFFSWI